MRIGPWTVEKVETHWAWGLWLFGGGFYRLPPRVKPVGLAPDGIPAVTAMHAHRHAHAVLALGPVRFELCLAGAEPLGSFTLHPAEPTDDARPRPRTWPDNQDSDADWWKTGGEPPGGRP